MIECDSQNTVETGSTLVIWDAEGAPPVGNWTTVLWRHYACSENAAALSIARLVEQEAEELRTRYLAWIHDLGEAKIAGMRVIDHLAIRPGLSYWWMSSLAQKFNVSGKSQIDDAIKALALEKLAVSMQTTSITLVSGNRPLAAAIQHFCKAKGVGFKLRQPGGVPATRRCESLYERLPHSWQALIYLGWSLLRGTTLLLRKRAAPPSIVGEVTFVDVLVHLDKQAIATGRFISNYWTDLVGKIAEWEIRSNWLHVFFRHTAVPSLATARRQIDCFNDTSGGSQYHSLIECSLNPSTLVRTLRDYFRVSRSLARVRGIDSIRPQGSHLDLWPLHAEEWVASLCGKEAMVNCLRVSLFENAVRGLPLQKLGVFISENQPWEMALIYAWKAAGHGTLIGTPHTTLRFWDLRYHYDVRSYTNGGAKRLPLPDILAVNGPVARANALASGYPADRVREVEALRFLHLLRGRTGNEARRLPKDGLCVLVCGDFLAETNRKILGWLRTAAESLPSDTVFVFKPHPAYPLNPADYSATKLQISEAPLRDLLEECDVAFTSNITSAAVDAYCSGVPVIQMLDGDTVNVSPLRGLDGVMYVTNPTELVSALRDVKQCGRRLPEPYFYLDAGLPRWKELLNILPKV